MSDIDAAGMSHIGPKKDIVRERVARSWHEGSDHAADEPFGGPLCNCDRVAGRIMPMLAEAWASGRDAESRQAQQRRDYSSLRTDVKPSRISNPYETEEDRHADQ